jgi:hypothetical protein
VGYLIDIFAISGNPRPALLQSTDTLNVAFNVHGAPAERRLALNDRPRQQRRRHPT